MTARFGGGVIPFPLRPVSELMAERRLRRVIADGVQRVSLAEQRRETAICLWLQKFPTGTDRCTDTDVEELLGYIPHLTPGRARAFFEAAQTYLLNAANCPDGDPEQAVNDEMFRQAVRGIVADDAQAAAGETTA